jgi:hypothetical protein
MFGLRQQALNRVRRKCLIQSPLIKYLLLITSCSGGNRLENGNLCVCVAQATRVHQIGGGLPAWGLCVSQIIALSFAYVTLEQSFAILRFGTLSVHEVALVMLSPPKFVSLPYCFSDHRELRSTGFG